MCLQYQKCGKQFNIFKKYIIHTQYVHPDINKNFTCPKPKCKRVFNRKHTLKIHLRNIHKFHDAIGINEIVNDVDNSRTSNNSASLSETNEVYLTDADKANENTQDEYINYIECFKKLHKTNVVKIISELYNLDIPRIRIQEILDCFSSFQSTHIEIIFKMLSLSEAQETSEILKNIREMLSILKDPFLELNTEFKRFKYFEDSGKLLMPQKVLIGIGKD